MNVLLIGSGGREHALAKALAASSLCNALFIAPGNPGTAALGTNVAIDVTDHEAVARFCGQEKIGFVVVGPEAPLVAGIVDDLEALGIRCFGPTRAAARLEGSKAFTRELCRDFDIPGAAFARFTDAKAATAHIREAGAPIVVKADGLAAGKGVVVAATPEEAIAAAEAMLSVPGAEIVIEECLVGEEASVFAICDGDEAILFGTAQDHKRAFDGDEGPNTGGMGAYSPARIVTPAIEDEILSRIIRPTLAGMRGRGAPFKGVLYAGLMLTADGPKLIEYNVRFGDPEAEVLMPRLRSDLLSVMIAAREGRIAGVSPDWSDETALTVIMATRGYPGKVGRGSRIGGIEAAEAKPGVTVYHAGTAREEGELIAAGGRVLAVTATAPTVSLARARAYAGIDAIDWPDGFCRRDIGYREVAREAEAG